MTLVVGSRWSSPAPPEVALGTHNDSSAPTHRLRVVLLCDEPLTRYALRHLLNGWQGRTAVVGESGDTAEVTRTLSGGAADLVLVDAAVGAPDPADVTTLTERLGRPGAPRTLLLIGSAYDQVWQTALRPHLHGTVHRRTDLSDVLIAVQAVGRGATYLDGRQRSDDGPTGRTHAPLTRRETEVLEQVALGRTNNEIATTLCISSTTVKFHVSGLLRKFEVRGRSDLAFIAGQRGMR
jgi:DNA-binding NarL/FixJ family response regulator